MHYYYVPVGGNEERNAKETQRFVDTNAATTAQQQQTFGAGVSR